jgi:hypothetical protein
MAHVPPRRFTPEQEEVLRVLWETTSKSASEIAREVGGGFTRSGMCGLASRRGWAKRGPRTTGSRLVKNKQEQVSKPARKRAVATPVVAAQQRWTPAPESEPAPTLGPTEVLFLDVGSRQCHWPTGGEGAGMLCCGAATRSGRVYCDEHHKAGWHAARQPSARTWHEGRARR